MTGPEQHPRLASSDNQALSKPHIPTGPNVRSTFPTILAEAIVPAKSRHQMSPTVKPSGKGSSASTTYWLMLVIQA